MFWMRNKENKFLIRTLIWRPDKIKNCFLAYWVILHAINLDTQIFLHKNVIFLSVSCNICFGCIKVALRRFFEVFTTYMFWLRNKKISFLITHSYTEACMIFCRLLLEKIIISNSNMNTISVKQFESISGLTY